MSLRARIRPNTCHLLDSHLNWSSNQLHSSGDNHDMRNPITAVFLVGALTLGSALVRAQDLVSFEKRITLKVLDNGLTVIVCERPEAPVFSFFTHVDVGSDREYPGITGLAHMFEHMAFKGTDKIGTKNYTAEKETLAKVERAYQAYIAERDKTVG